MGEFGWAYISGSVTGTGPAESVQFLRTADGELTGSQNFTFDTANDKLFVTGSVVVSGTIQANTFDIIHTNVIELESSGSTNFGNDASDTHVFTGSVIISGSIKQSYYKLTAASYTVSTADSIIGVSSSAYTSILLPSASTAGAGHTLVIKDEYNATRATANQIAISASGGNTIDHATTYSITGDSAALTLYSDGTTNWFIY